MTKEELDQQLATVTTARQRLEGALRDWVPPDYFTQRDIDAEREHRRREIEAYEPTGGSCSVIASL